MYFHKQTNKRNIARIANAVPVTLYSKVTKQLLILLFSIVSNVIRGAILRQIRIFFEHCSKGGGGIVGKKRDPGILDPELFLGQIRKVEARLGKLAKIRKSVIN